MKKIAFSLLIAFLVLISNAYAISQQEINEIILEELNGVLDEHTITILTENMTEILCNEEYCNMIWDHQFLLENILIPILQALTALTDNPYCYFVCSGVIFDTFMWLPLACYCNDDAPNCVFWITDIIHNIAACSICL